MSIAPSDFSPAPESTRLRLHYLDGLRGLAAFYVVLHHALMEVVDVKGWLPDRWVAATTWAANGQIAVQVFIALSGYCLMMPVARTGQLKGGWRDFIWRRARRILPPYYAALALSLLLVFLVPGMRVPQGLRWDITLPATTPGVLGSHLLLLQDLRPEWIFKINYPMWTIAQEWQIYFVFVFALLPIWRRAGILAALGVALVVSVALRRIPGHDFSYAAPEFLFLFAVGMLAATLNFPAGSRWLVLVRDRVPWTLLSAGFWLAYLALMLRRPELTQIHSWRLTFLAAGAMLSTLVSCTNALLRERRASQPLLRLCELGPVVAIGTFSYSLYLVHAPILSLSSLALRHGQVAGPWAVAVDVLIAVPVAVAVAYGFHLLAEKPFMQGRPARVLQSERKGIAAQAGQPG